MNVGKLKNEEGKVLDGLLLISQDVYSDKRGFFMESWNESKYNNALGEKINFKQDNHSCSSTGVLRGLHYQLEPEPQAKLVSCIRGSIFDVAVDLRQSSHTFGKWVGIELNETKKQQFWIPIGFAHGFLSLSDHSEVLYKTNGYYNKRSERSIKWDDNDIGIKWPLEKIDLNGPLLSEKDEKASHLKDAIKSNNIYK